MVEPFVFLIVLVALLALVLLVLTRSIRFSRRERQLQEPVPAPVAQKQEAQVDRTSAETDDYLVKAVLTQRIEAIKNRKAQAVADLVDPDDYSKFDDWPPFELQQGSSVLKNEGDALKVLREYEYETSSWKVDILGDAAVASFVIHYKGKIRDLSFDIRSRVTAVLRKKEGDWRIVHEHWSRIP